jgi:transposase
MDGSHKNVEPHRPTQVHLLVDSMESTGVYWKPVLNVLEDDSQYLLKVILANPQQVKAVTGHKTDPHDARWLAHLLRHGMIRPSLYRRARSGNCATSRGASR